MSLASQSALVITGIRLADGREDLLGVASVRWQGSCAAPEECSIGDLIRWIDRNHGHAYVQGANGSRGPRLQVIDGPTRRYVRSGPASDGHDSLLALPRF